MPERRQKNIGVMTSGGDAQGMNAAVRAVVRTALEMRVDVFAIHEGYRGMVEGGDRIQRMHWGSVGGILHQGGTTIGTARCREFREREGRLRAAHNLVERKIDSLVIIGGDGSLSGANEFRQEWSSLLAELVETGVISQEAANRHPNLTIAGLVGSIDNDMFGTDMTIGADTALHRITDAIDAISSTAASHQRSFVIEVMGRRCGYLALMGAIATGADWVLIPERPPDVDDWEERMCEVLRQGRAIGRRDTVVVVAEGAQDRHGNPITSDYVKQVLEERLGEDTRVTILGHVQRGGAPGAYDRYMSTVLGHAAVERIMSGQSDGEAFLVGMRENRITYSPLMECVEKTRAVAKEIAARNYDAAMDLRGGSFKEAFQMQRTFVRALPHEPPSGQRRLRIAVMNAGGPAPGMNTAVRAAVRLGIDRGHTMLGVEDGFPGLAEGHLHEMDWMSVANWTSMGGSELGTNRKVPQGRDLYMIARHLEEHDVDALLMIGGWAGYQGTHRLFIERDNFSAFNIPIVCLPASINNNLPGSELSIGSDTALNSIVDAVDKIKQSAVASRRCFVVEVMGRHCGYLSLLSGLATGAERVYLPEEGVSLKDMQADLDYMMKGFSKGKRLGLVIRNEGVNPVYTTGFMSALFEEEGGDLFDVRQAVLGHMQQGGDPTPFDRIQATRLVSRCIDYIITEAQKDMPGGAFIGLKSGHVKFSDLEDMPRMMDYEFARPKQQWWLELRTVARVMAQPGPSHLIPDL